MPNVDLYQILGVSKTATSQDIKTAYRTLAKIYHPDKNAGNQREATIKIQQINEAYRVLADPQKRVAYDRADNSKSEFYNQEFFKQPETHHQSSVAKIPTDFSIYVEENCIDLSYIDVSLTNDVDITELGVFLNKQPNITEINLSHCNFRINPHHQKNTTWTNIIGNEGMIHGNIALEKIFQFNPGTSLDLSSNKGCKNFGFIPRDSDGIFSNLKKLDLSDCDVNTTHFLCLLRYSKGGSKNTYHNLEVLVLSHNQIGDLEQEQLNKLVRQFEALPNLRFLDLSYNKLSYDGLEKLLAALSHGSNTIETINFEGNNISTTQYDELCTTFPNYTEHTNVDDNIEAHTISGIQNSNIEHLTTTSISTKEELSSDLLYAIKQFASEINEENFAQIKIILDSNIINSNQKAELVTSLHYIQHFINQDNAHYISELIGMFNVNEA